MTIYKVNYNKFNTGKYLSGSNCYYEKTSKLFTTREKAEEFVANAEMEFVPTWKKEVEVKEANYGTIEEVEVE
jgi:hypothetical protein